MQEITEKKCPKCNAIKPLGAFSKGEHGRFGHASYCKACMLEYHKKKQTDPLYRERQRRRSKEWAMKYPDRVKQNQIRLGRKYKLQAMQKISASLIPHCEKCGCDDIRILEVNHKNGGGAQEGNKHIYQDILSGKRSLDDLNILCKVCNAHDYLERKYGVLPFSINWDRRYPSD